jgi:hypothetical protein
MTPSRQKANRWGSDALKRAGQIRRDQQYSGIFTQTEYRGALVRTAACAPSTIGGRRPSRIVAGHIEVLLAACDLARVNLCG